MWMVNVGGAKIIYVVPHNEVPSEARGVDVRYEGDGTGPEVFPDPGGMVMEIPESLKKHIKEKAARIGQLLQETDEVYVNCQSGHYRSVVVVCLYLITNNHAASPEAAAQMLSDAHDNKKKLTGNNLNKILTALNWILYGSGMKPGRRTAGGK